MSAQETYYLAHTARCKLQMAADRPDRNLRFLLGHAFTLDKLLLRVVEIESESSSDDDLGTADDDFDMPTCTAQRVSFRSHKPASTSPARNRSPPPAIPLTDSDSDSSDEEDVYEDEEGEDEGLSLQRFESATAKPPRMIADEDGSDEDEDEPKSPPSIPSDVELAEITKGAENEDLTDLYEHVHHCPCHGKKDNAPVVAKAWDIPQKESHQGKRLAVVQVVA
ncbi:hypothetical protein EG329_013901 [Mollisiaceae sp. DMI_Dod_QoI]|nr:hypothetical protein EG329_013901 [Helotiales sp. DMI_Dod_QoI]